MEILSSASSSEKIWTKRRRNPFGLCVGCMASANRLLLLYYAGYRGWRLWQASLLPVFHWGVFMAYTYMKTQNIWVPIIIHFLNNNMAVVFSGTYSADVLQNQQIHWGDIPVALVMNLLIFGWVIFLKPFKEKKRIILNSFKLFRTICRSTCIFRNSYFNFMYCRLDDICKN